MDLSTSYVGLTLKSPIVPSSSPLMAHLDVLKRLEDSGAGGVVLHSLFEEQVTNEALMIHYHTTQGTDSYAEALSYFPEPSQYIFPAEEYVEYIRKVKSSLEVPVFASINGVTAGGWIRFARLIEEAGADGIELNIYYIPTDPYTDGSTLEEAYCEVVQAVRETITIPLIVKMNPFFTSIPAMARRFCELGVNGLVLFNRFYQPDLDIENLTVSPHIVFSDSHALRLPVRWTAILYQRISASLAISGGVHTPEDVIKGIMAGADVTMMCSAIITRGPSHIKNVIEGVKNWMETHEYSSLTMMKGTLSQISVAEPAAYERALYIKGLQSIRYK
ncbi:MAG: dihydroorotate dehydrogenase-like protein [bacterium]